MVFKQILLSNVLSYFPPVHEVLLNKLSEFLSFLVLPPLFPLSSSIHPQQLLFIQTLLILSNQVLFPLQLLLNCFPVLCLLQFKGLSHDVLSSYLKVVIVVEEVHHLCYDPREDIFVEDLFNGLFEHSLVSEGPERVFLQTHEVFLSQDAGHVFLVGVLLFLLPRSLLDSPSV